MLDLYEIQRNCLRLMGHNDTLEKSGNLSWWHQVKHIGVALLVFSAQAPMIYYTIYNIGDITLVTYSLSIIFTNLLTVTKITTFLWYKAEFVALMMRLDEMFAQMREPEPKRILVGANKFAIKLVKLYYYSVWSTVLYFFLGPIVKLVWYKVKQQQYTREFPLPMRFPFDFESTPGYECCYLYSGFATLWVALYNVVTEGLFISFSINLRAHFQVLQYLIKSNTFRKVNELLQRDIGSCLQYHVLLLDLAKDVRRIYKPIVFVQFLMTSLLVCVIVYQVVSHLDSLIGLTINCTYLSTIMLQFFIYCYGGEILKNESLLVGTAVQLSNWYNLPPKFRRMMLLIMLRSQREAIIQAGFYEASLANFMAILRAAGSYITLIQSLD